MGYIYEASLYSNATSLGSFEFIYLVYQDPVNNKSNIKYALKAYNIPADGSVTVTGIKIQFNDKPGYSQGKPITVTLPGEFLTGEPTYGDLTVQHYDSGKPVKVKVKFEGLLNARTVSFYEGDLYIPDMNGVMFAVGGVTPFNDEQNPTLKLAAVGRTSELKSIQVCLSLDGETPFTEWKSTGINTTTFTFHFTDSERVNLRNAITDTDNKQVYFIVKSNYTNTVTQSSYSLTHRGSTTLTIINAHPILEPTVVDDNEKTLALTGNENIFIKGYSDGRAMFNHQGVKGASIVWKKISVDGKHASTTQSEVSGITRYAVIDPTFDFTVQDSRGLITTKTITKDVIDYIPLTCKQKVRVELEEGDVDETSARITLIISGNYWDGNFGAVRNTLKLEVRHTQEDGTMGDWVDLSPLMPEPRDNKYEMEVNITGNVSYDTHYTFQCRATDKLVTVETEEKESRYLPVFDWSDEDFNFNVPVRFQQGFIMGDSEFNIQDYVIEQGSTAMGTNGTWYWTKWNSGKAECYGTRNFGKVNINNNWGNGLYESVSYNQALPSGLFSETPNIQMTVGECGYGVLIQRGAMETSMSSSNTGSFYFVRPSSAVTASSYVSFYCIGRWD